MEMTVGQARDFLRERAADGARCPCCNQMVKVYRRRINAGMARSLIVMYRESGLDWCYVPAVVGSRSREEGKLRYWGLVEEELTRRPDGGRAGYWRVTGHGEAWVLGETTVPMYAHVYNSRCLKLEGDPVTIHEALGARFSYAELMSA